MQGGDGEFKPMFPLRQGESVSLTIRKALLVFRYLYS